MRALYRRERACRALFFLACACLVLSGPLVGAHPMVGGALVLVAVALSLIACIERPLIDEVLVAHERVELALASLPAKGRA